MDPLLRDSISSINQPHAYPHTGSLPPHHIISICPIISLTRSKKPLLKGKLWRFGAGQDCAEVHVVGRFFAIAHLRCQDTAITLFTCFSRFNPQLKFAVQRADLPVLPKTLREPKHPGVSPEMRKRQQCRCT